MKTNRTNNDNAPGNVLPGSRGEDQDSEQIHTLAALRTSELRFRRLFESAQDGILILDAETGRVVEVNPFLIDLLGYSRETFLGKKVWELGPFKDIIGNQENFAELQQQGYIWYADKPLETADGRRIDVEFVSNVYQVDHHRVIQCNIRDISKRRREDTYRELGPAVLQILNEPGDLQMAMQRVLAVLKTRTGCDAVGIRLQEGEDFPYFTQEGFSREFLLTENTLLERGPNGGICRDQDGKPKLECTCGLVISGKTDPTHPLFTRGGSFWTNDSLPLLDLPPDQDPRFHPRNNCIHQGYASVALIPIRNNDRIVGLIHFNDRRKRCFTLESVELLETIAAHIGSALMRKQSEQALHQSEQQLRMALEAAHAVAWVSDVQTGTLVESGPVDALFGKPPGFLHTSVQALLEDIHPDDRPHVLEALQSGSNKASGTYAVEYRVPFADGKIRWLQASGRFECDAENRPVRLRGIARDVTELKQAEFDRERLRDQLVQGQKMESVGRLAGGVAHDFNNMLQVIVGTIDILMEVTPPADPRTADLKTIRMAAKRSAALTAQLLAFARKQAIAPIVLDLNATIERQLTMLRRLIGEHIDLHWKPSANAVTVKIDPSQLNQILTNLMINARDAIGATGTLAIETAVTDIDEDYGRNHPGAVPGPYVVLSVGDNGCGMDKTTLEHVFEPFFTTKEVGKGTGLGLATVYGIVQQNHGFVNVYSEPGVGTTFTIYLPRYDKPSLPHTEEHQPAEMPTGTETVLLVEDEKTVRQLVHRQLNQLGYTVIVAESPIQAIQYAQEHVADIQLLLSDVIMPEMRGPALHERLLALRPAIRCVLMSGYTAEAIAQHNVLETGVRFLQKPFTKKALAIAVRTALDQGKRANA